ncbi:MAG: flagellar basal body P-ring formation chaperone FlgA [Thermodesulfobacteriota bacterium]
MVRSKILKIYLILILYSAILIYSLAHSETKADLQNGYIIEAERVMRILEDFLKTNLEKQNRSVKISEIRGFKKIFLPEGVLSWEIKLPDRFFQGGGIPVTLTFYINGRKVQEVHFQAQVEIYAWVVVAKNYLPKHQLIKESDVHLVYRNITKYPADVLTETKEVIGKRASLHINAWEVLRKSMVEVPPLVKKGDYVTLLAENEGFRITAIGEVKEEGRQGEIVKVLNISSKKEIFGRVLDSQTVQVDF